MDGRMDGWMDGWMDGLLLRWSQGKLIEWIFYCCWIIKSDSVF